jgi:hypothetical protein
MAILHVAEFPGLGRADQSDSITVLPVPPTVEQQVIVSASGVIISNPFQPSTKFVELCTDTTCSIVFGVFNTLTTATVTTGSGRLNANERLIRAVPNQSQIPSGSNYQVPPVQYGLVVIIST